MNISSDDIIFRRAAIQLLDVENGNFEAARELLFSNNAYPSFSSGSFTFSLIQSGNRSYGTSSTCWHTLEISNGEVISLASQ